MFHGQGQGRPFEMKNSELIIGRGENCDLRIPLNSVSRKHCRIELDETLRVDDMGSSNGTFVNGRRIQSIELEPGDTIQIGPVVFVVQIDGDPPTSDMHPIRAGFGDESKTSDSTTSLIDGSHPDVTPTIQADQSHAGQSADADKQPGQ